MNIISRIHSNPVDRNNFSPSASIELFIGGPVSHFDEWFVGDYLQLYSGQQS